VRAGEVEDRELRVPDSLWTALALLLILEGLLPFAAPRIWRDGFRRLTELTDGQLRFIGMISVCVGLLGLYLTQGG
jgi:uncharacterized protein